MLSHDDRPPLDEQLGIAGSGAIACGLAVLAARGGEVVLWARSDASAARAGATVRKLCERLDGEVEPERVRIETELEALAGQTTLVEAIAEDHDIKCQLLARLSALAAPGALLATTTSSLSVAALAQASAVPERFLGLHVFNPVTKMELVELVFPASASQDTRERARALCRALGKTAVEVPDLPGFVVNRLLFPYLFGAVELMEQTGMQPADVDACMTLGAGHPMGPLALLDLVGLDVSVAIGEAIGASIPPRLHTLIAAGAVGRKAGRGLYDYDVASSA